MRFLSMHAAAVALCVTGAALAQQPQPAPSKPATAATKAANQKVLQTLPFNDRPWPCCWSSPACGRATP